MTYLNPYTKLRMKWGIALETKYIISLDGAKIAYQVLGKGPALLLVHGAGAQGKSRWIEYGWAKALEKYFTVIIPDLRGFGESDKSYEENFYSIDKILDDLNAIVRECGFKEYYYFGHSYGATIGFQACKRSESIKKAICAGSYFGDDFFKIIVPTWIREYEDANLKKKENKLSQMGLSDEEIDWIEKTDLNLWIAQFKAWNKWDGVHPKDIKAKLFVYTGTKDTENIVEHIRKQEEDIKNHNITLKVFENLNHDELIRKIETVSPWVIDFFMK